MTDKPIIADAVRTLNAFNIKTWAQAARLLPLWARYPELSEDDKTAVLNQFSKKS